MNSGGPWPSPKSAQERVLGIQRKLHKWSTDGQDRRFRRPPQPRLRPGHADGGVAAGQGESRVTLAGVDGKTAYHIEQVLGVQRFLEGLREELRSGSFRPLPVKERLIPKRDGKKFRRLGVPALRDRVVQAALKLVLEPIFEADFQPCSYGFRPGRRCQDAIAEIHYLTTRSYEWIVEADIKACFDELSHSAILARVRQRVADKRVLALIKAFLKAGIMSEQGRLRGTVTGTPQGGILSPLMANVALNALDQHFVRAWEAMGDNSGQRQRRRLRGEPTYRLVRYCDDFVIVVAGERRHAEALIAEVEQTIEPLGLTLSREKTSIAHIDEGFEFLGWKIKRQPGRNGRPQIYTYPSKRSLQAVMGKVKQITRTGQNQTLDQLLHRLNPMLRGWCAYFRHGVSSRTFNYLRAYTWRRVTIWLRAKHRGRNWRWLRHRYLPGWWPTAETVGLYNPGGVKIVRYRYRGSKIPTPWEQPEYQQLSFDLDRLQALIAR